jgi:hypothetical protein
MCNSGAGCGDWALHDLSKIGVLRIGMQTEWQYAGPVEAEPDVTALPWYDDAFVANGTSTV